MIIATRCQCSETQSVMIILSLTRPTKKLSKIQRPTVVTFSRRSVNVSEDEDAYPRDHEDDAASPVLNFDFVLHGEDSDSDHSNLEDADPAGPQESSSDESSPDESSSDESNSDGSSSNGSSSDDWEDDDAPPHVWEDHIPDDAVPAGLSRQYHEHIDRTPCDEDGNYLPPDTPPTPPPTKSSDDWSPYRNRIEFEVASLLYARQQASGGFVDELMDLWQATLLKHNDHGPFSNNKDLHHTIDSTELGDVKWESFEMRYSGEIPERNVPQWMTAGYDVWFRDPHTVIRNMLSNPDFDGEIDYGPFHWAWKQADIIAQDPNNAGAAFVPIILGSDKTTVSVATGQNEYYPLYASIGNVHNSVRRAHRNAVALIGFLAIPKTTREYKDDPKFRKFRRQLFHTSLSRILQSLKPGMTTPEVTHCADGHFRRVIYGLGPYIADYPEQALLACIVQGWCPRCTAPNSNLDGPDGGRRTREHTEELVAHFELGMLWNEYGPRRGYCDDLVVLVPSTLSTLLRSLELDPVRQYAPDRTLRQDIRAHALPPICVARILLHSPLLYCFHLEAALASPEQRAPRVKSHQERSKTCWAVASSCSVHVLVGIKARLCYHLVRVACVPLSLPLDLVTIVGTALIVVQAFKHGSCFGDEDPSSCPHRAVLIPRWIAPITCSGGDQLPIVKGLTHHDLKAVNLLVDEDGMVLLGNLGIATCLWDERRHLVPALDPEEHRQLRPIPPHLKVDGKKFFTRQAADHNCNELLNAI
ncbi:hypothetical protein A0H81_11949 [Grifola frondosa]|uniref:Protein kinase domain-containing protein n=1 Tax=Grifola frondosa TaxID=5627 RepID=A0A1C7LTJ5_GRIFR|nr:hypothetical protein A0H81_11949 [Grifola frondosa]